MPGMSDKLINKDVTKRILSVLLALLLWFYVITEQNPDIIKDITIPVRLVNTVFLEENNMVLVNDPGSFSLTLKIKGKNKVLDKLNENTVEAVADLEGHNLKGDNFINININGIPEDVNILQKSLESLKVVLESKVNIQKSVQVDLVGDPSQGLAAMTPVMIPNDVVIMGAESLIQKIRSVKVDVDIAGATGEVNKILPVRVLDENGKDINNIIVDPGNVEVSIPIENTKLVSLETDLTGKPAEGYKINNITVEPKEILVTGNQHALAGINSIKIEKIVITDETADVLKEVGLVLPEGIEITNDIKKVKILIDIEKIVTSEITIENFEYLNLPEDLKLDSVQGDFTASLKGAESQISNAANNIKFFIDLKNATEGTNTLDVLWEAPEEIEILNVLPHQAVVVLKKIEP